MNSSRTPVPGLPRAFSRRTALRLGLGVAAAGVLGACSQNTAGSSSGAAGKKLVLPTYVAPKQVDGAIVSKIDGVPNAYPSFGTPFKSVPNVPGKGGTVTTFQPLFRSPPPALGDNPWWQELNKRLGVEIKPTLAPSASYADKLAASIAGNDLPDLTFVTTVIAPAAARSIKQGAFLDLTDRLSGDGVKAYPNLAGIPTYAWQDASVENRIYGVPHAITKPLGGKLYRQDWAAALGYPNEPKNSDELKQVLVAFTKANPKGKTTGDTYAFSTLSNGLNFIKESFRVPNNWRVDNGAFSHFVESDEYEQALTYAADLWKAGVWYPDAPAEDNNTADDLWLSGRAGYYGVSIVPLFDRFFVEGAKTIVPPGHDGGKPGVWSNSGAFGFAGIPSSIKDDQRIDELLQIMNWWASPFGSEEYLFLMYGQQGRHFAMQDGQPVPTEDEKIQTERNLYYLVETYEAQVYFPGHPERANEAQKQLERVVPVAVADPSIGLVSNTAISKAAALKQLIVDYESGIVTGRRSIQELADLRSRWKSGGGDAMKKEFAASYAAAK
jgi:putative aldouronate transport system substrate-binding protein